MNISYSVGCVQLQLLKDCISCHVPINSFSSFGSLVGRQKSILLNYFQMSRTKMLQDCLLSCSWNELSKVCSYLPKPPIFVVLLEYKVGKLFYFKVNGKSSAVKCLMETAVNCFLFPKFTEFYHFHCIKCIASSFNDVVTRLVCISALTSL